MNFSFIGRCNTRYQCGGYGVRRVGGNAVMAKATQARLDASLDLEVRADTDHTRTKAVMPSTADLRLDIYEDLSKVEREWRAFEQEADCTVFQTFDWLATWYRHIGIHSDVRPAIVIGRDASGAIQFLLPFALRNIGVARELTWLGSELCDCNAPLLAPNFSRASPPAHAAARLQQVLSRLRKHPQLAYDLVRLEKMPERVGNQPNPILSLGTRPNPSGTHMTELASDWNTFYRSKRSSATRRRDRTKRKRLSEMGEVRFVTPKNDDDIVGTLDILMEQKARSFAQMGIANMFARPGYREFYRALATGATSRNLTHVSRLEVGPVAAAVNFGLTFRGRYYYLLASYGDGEVSRFGPGAAHLHELMRYAIERGLRIFDFTIGDEAYKRDWCESSHALHDHISGATLRGQLIALPIRGWRLLKRWIKQTPILWRAASTARSLVGALRRRRTR